MTAQANETHIATSLADRHLEAFSCIEDNPDGWSLFLSHWQSAAGDQCLRISEALKV